jgi:hypothetical protein
MARAGRIGWWSAAVLALALGAVASPAVAADPAREALAHADVYASPRALGAGTADARRRLEQAASELAAEGRPVKLAVVPGPGGASSMRLYARRLARAAGIDDTLVVSAPGRGVAVEGPLSPAETTRLLRAARLGAVADPVERAIAGARATAPFPPDEGHGHPTLVLFALAVLGAAGAVGVGLRRETRRGRDALLERRGAVRVRLDALRARAAVLAARTDLPGRVPALADGALARCDEILASLQRALTMEQVDALDARVRAGLAALDEAAASVGEHQPAGDPFAGLCANDPAHGPAADPEAALPLCADCRDAARRGEAQGPRMVSVDGRPVPFSEVP